MSLDFAKAALSCTALGYDGFALALSRTPQLLVPRPTMLRIRAALSSWPIASTSSSGRQLQMVDVDAVAINWFACGEGL